MGFVPDQGFVKLEPMYNWAHAQNVLRRYTLQYVCSLRTILKICAKYAQFAHITKKFFFKCLAPIAGHPSKHWAGPMFE